MISLSLVSLSTRSLEIRVKWKSVSPSSSSSKRIVKVLGGRNLHFAGRSDESKGAKTAGRSVEGGKSLWMASIRATEPGSSLGNNAFVSRCCHRQWCIHSPALTIHMHCFHEGVTKRCQWCQKHDKAALVEVLQGFCQFKRGQRLFFCSIRNFRFRLASSLPEILV